MKQKIICIGLTLLFCSFFLVVADEPADAQTNQLQTECEMQSLLFEIQGAIAQELGMMSGELELNAKELRKTGFSEPEADNLLEGILKKVPYAISSTVLNRVGTLIAIKPDTYASLKGKDLSEQQQVINLYAEKWPLLSPMFPIAEGEEAVVMSYPLYATQGDCIVGMTSLTFLPADMLTTIVPGYVTGTDYSVTIIDLTGRILYDTNPAKIGMMSFSDKRATTYSSLQKFVTDVTDTWSGHGYYEYGTDNSSESVIKEAYWTTVYMHGSRWRILIENVPDAPDIASISYLEKS